MDIITLLFIIIILISIYLAYICTSTNESDESVSIHEGYGNYCGNCRGRTLGQCMECMNCGYLAKGNYGKCIEGDVYGPAESNRLNPTDKGARWIYNDHFWTDVLVSDNIVHPATSSYPNRYPKYPNGIY